MSLGKPFPCHPCSHTHTLLITPYLPLCRDGPSHSLPIQNQPWAPQVLTLFQTSTFLASSYFPLAETPWLRSPVFRPWLFRSSQPCSRRYLPGTVFMAFSTPTATSNHLVYLNFKTKNQSKKGLIALLHAILNPPG